MSPESRTRRRPALGAARDRLRAHALGYPESREEFPWGEPVVKVRGRVFVFFGAADGGLALSVKLPGSALLALGLPFATPTAYGLGRSGWVTARFARGDRPPLPLLERWIDESYRAVAPKRLAASLAARGAAVRRAPAARAARAGAARRAAPRAKARSRRARP